MFRPLRRIKQQLIQEECISVLKNEVRGVLSVLGDNGYPYGVPINYWYSEDENKIYFHGSKDGHKIDSIKKHNKVFVYMIKEFNQRSKRDLILKV